MLNHKINVLHIITRIDLGGSTTNTIETVARLNPSQYQCTLIFGRTNDPDGRITQELKEKNINYILIDDLRRDIHLWHDFKAFLKLIRYIKSNTYDIVHTHTSKAGILGRWAAKIAGVKKIVHTPHGHVFYGYFNPLVTKIFIAIEQLTAAMTDKIITLTERGKQEHVYFRIAKAEKFIPIYSGISLADLESCQCDMAVVRESLGISLDAVVFGTVARLEPIKGLKYLIEAMASVYQAIPASKLLIIGDGQERQFLEAAAQTLNLDKAVIFAGHRENVAQLMQVMDIFVLPSLNEGMGRVILEAMAFAKPVIATKTGGIPELVIDGKTGRLVEPGMSHSLAQAMIQLGTDKNLRIKFGLSGKELLKDTYTLEHMVKKIENLYSELMLNKK